MSKVFSIVCALVLGAAVVLIVVLASGHGLHPDPVNDTRFAKVNVDGTTCVVARSYRAVALSCEWPTP